MDNRTILQYVPGGGTSKLQVLDVGVNKPFKDKMKSLWTLNMVAMIQEAKAAGQMNAIGWKPKVSREMLADWCLEAWDSITVETITNTWRKIGFQ